MASFHAPKVKICGITTPDALNAAVEAQADFIGLVFYDRSPRSLNGEKAAQLINRLPDHLTAVGLFVDADNEEIDAVLKHTKLDMLQLHGVETPSRIAALKSRYGLPVIKAVKISAPEDLVMIGPAQSIADWILFDAKVDQSSALPGGNGVVFDWQLLKNLKVSKPWMLSGGLSLDNIKLALDTLKPDAFDVSSGVEDGPGLKNSDKIREFIRIVKSF